MSQDFRRIQRSRALKRRGNQTTIVGGGGGTVYGGGATGTVTYPAGATPSVPPNTTPDSSEPQHYWNRYYVWNETPWWFYGAQYPWWNQMYFWPYYQPFAPALPSVAVPPYYYQPAYPYVYAPGSYYPVVVR
jgi:hypothetical protein